MSYQDGWAALNLDMPARVPRTEYSITRHWPALCAITGLNVSEVSSPEVQREAGNALMKAWDFSFIWATGVRAQFMSKGRTTKMGHAEYAAGGGDYDDQMTCPFTSPEEVLCFDPETEYGPIDKAERIRDFEDAYRKRCDDYPHAVNMAGVYTTMISGFIDIFGWDMLLLAMGADPRRFGEMAGRYERWVKPHFEALAESNIPVVMCHDDIAWTSGPFASPDWYREYLFPAFRRLWRPIIDAGKRLCYTSDGDYSMFFDDIVDCGAHCLVMEPCCDMAGFARRYGKTHAFIGNADCRILLSGSRDDIRGEVERCMRIGKDCPGFFMAVGNHIPANTPVENCVYYNDVYMELRNR